MSNPMVSRYLHRISHEIFLVPARWFVRCRLSPDAVSLLGVLGVVGGSCLCFVQGDFFWGSIVVGFFATFDIIDGLMARAVGRNDLWGAFLDSTLDRLGDSSIFAGFMLCFLLKYDNLWMGLLSLLCLILGNLVSYSRARAESLGVQARVGVAGRPMRLVCTLVVAGLTGLGLPLWVFGCALTLVAALSAVTVVQRMVATREALSTGCDTPDGIQRLR